MTRQLSAERMAAIKANIALGRFGLPREVAELAGFLVHACYITGQVGVQHRVHACYITGQVGVQHRVECLSHISLAVNYDSFSYIS